MEVSSDTILLVCGSEAVSVDILGKLYDNGINVVGPAANASYALAMAAQIFPTIALMASPPLGRRNAVQLAEELNRTWGIPSLVLERATGGEYADVAADWRAPTERVAHIRRALAGHAPLDQGAIQ